MRAAGHGFFQHISIKERAMANSPRRPEQPDPEQNDHRLRLYVAMLLISAYVVLLLLMPWVPAARDPLLFLGPFATPTFRNTLGTSNTSHRLRRSSTPDDVVRVHSYHLAGDSSYLCATYSVPLSRSPLLQC